MENNMTDHEIVSEIRRALDIEAAAVQTLSHDADPQALVACVRALASCRGKVILSGCGTSAMAAKKIAHSLNCVEVPALFLAPSDAVHGALGVLQPDDILILISKGGNTQELIPLLRVCQAKGALLIGVSENPDSAIARSSGIFLRVKVAQEADYFNMLATASTLAVISLFDSVCVALMQLTGYTRSQFALIHPGGAVGERLLHHSAQTTEVPSDENV